MGRSLVKSYVKDASGNAIMGARVAIKTKATLVTAPGAFAAETGGVAVEAVLTNEQGEAVFWLDAWVDFVDLVVSDNDDTATVTGTVNRPVSFGEITERVPVAVGSGSLGANIADANGTLGDLTTKFNTLLARLRTRKDLE